LNDQEIVTHSDGTAELVDPHLYFINDFTVGAKGIDISHAALTKILPTNAKMCEGCAFRAGSQERRDPYHWANLVESFCSGGAFLCHEGIPGHNEQKPGVPLRLCAGRAAADKMRPGELLNLAHFDEIEMDVNDER
jgi:hypothetical protein